MADKLSSFTSGLTAPGNRAVAITPDDEADLAEVTRGIYVGVSGDLVVDLANAGESAVTFVGLAAGMVHPLRVLRVYEATTATNILGIY